MTVYINTDFYARSWLGLKDPLTGATLRLEPGERISLDLPQDFSDPWLKPASQSRPKASESPTMKKEA